MPIWVETNDHIQQISENYILNFYRELERKKGGETEIGRESEEERESGRERKMKK